MGSSINNQADDGHTIHDKIKFSKNKIKFTFSIVVSLILITSVFTVANPVLFNKVFSTALGQLSNQSRVLKDKSNTTSKSPTLVESNMTGNITKMTTTQGNQTTNANAASTFPPKEANSTNTFPDTNKVAIVMGAALLRDKAYQPNPVNVKVAGTVTWTNEDSVVHTVTSGSGFNDPNLGRDFDSGMLGKGFSHIFFKPGVFPYFCQIHPTMVGKVIVK